MELRQEREPAIPSARTRPRSFRLAAAIGVALAVVAVFAAWGADWGRPPALRSSEWSPTFRYVNSGWISPNDWQEFGPFANDLRAFVIVNQEQLDSFEGRLHQQGEPRQPLHPWGG